METTSSHGRRSFRVLRKSGQAGDALESFEWQPSKDSDELFEALKFAFPKGKTHRSRMREALISFLVQECEAEHDLCQEPQPLGPRLSNESTPNEHNVQQDNVIESSLAASPSSVQLPASKPGAVAKVPHRKRSPKDWDAMTMVWTSNDGLIHKTIPKRVMTEQERAEYQSRRAQGACASCKKKKRKCKHDVSKPGDINNQERKRLTSINKFLETIDTSQSEGNSRAFRNNTQLQSDFYLHDTALGRTHVKSPTSRPLQSILRHTAFGLSPKSPCTESSWFAQNTDTQTWWTDVVDTSQCLELPTGGNLLSIEQDQSWASHDTLLGRFSSKAEQPTTSSDANRSNTKHSAPMDEILTTTHLQPPKSYADLQSYTPSLIPSNYSSLGLHLTADFPATLKNNFPCIAEYAHNNSAAPNPNLLATAAAMANPDDVQLKSALSDINIVSDFGPSGSPRNIRNAWDREAPGSDGDRLAHSIQFSGCTPVASISNSNVPNKRELVAKKLEDRRLSLQPRQPAPPIVHPDELAQASVAAAYQPVVASISPMRSQNEEDLVITPSPIVAATIDNRNRSGGGGGGGGGGGFGGHGGYNYYSYANEGYSGVDQRFTLGDSRFDEYSSLGINLLTLAIGELQV